MNVTPSTRREHTQRSHLLVLLGGQPIEGAAQKAVERRRQDALRKIEERRWQQQAQQ